MLHKHCQFFFQAEDGIRDYKVTGVQTCALPISFYFYRDDKLFAAPGAFLDTNPNNHGVVDQPNTNIQTDWGFSFGGPVFLPKIYDGRKIGRASCRERE